MTELLKKQEERYSTNFGYSFPPMIEEMLNGYGYMNLQMGQPEKAFMFFKLNIDYFPKSPTAYNSMADYYEAQNDIPNAIRFVKKAAELSDSEFYEKRILELKKD